MPDDSSTADPNAAKPITSVTLTEGDPKPLNTDQPIQQVPQPQPEPVDPSNQVTIKAIRSFQGVEGFKNPQSEPFSVTRQRAADLFANGLVEYADEADEDAAIEAAAEAQVATVKAAAQARRTKKPTA